MITAFEYEVLRHASDTGRYVTGDARVIAMAGEGLLHDHGAQPLAAGDHHLVTTPKGRAALNEYRDSLPKPKKSRRSAAFDSWRDYCEANGRFGFREFLKEVWPHRHSNFATYYGQSA